MKMNHKIRSLFALLLSLLLALYLTACGGNSAPAEDSAAPSAPQAEYEEYAEGGYDYGYVVEDALDYPAEEPAEESVEYSSNTVRGEDVQTVKAETKLIYTAYLEVEALDFDAASDALDALVEELGGYYERSSVHAYGNRRTASYTVRVPSEHYRSFVEACSNSDNCHLNYISEEVEDIGAAYFDAETRLSTLRTKMERLQALLAEATLMEDIITIESAISETEYEIERYASTLNRYDSLVGFATVNIEMYEVIQLTEEEEESVLSRLGQELRWGAENFLDGVIDLMYWGAYNLIGIVFFVIFLVIVIRFVRSRKKKGPLFRRGKAESQPKQEEQSE